MFFMQPSKWKGYTIMVCVKRLWVIAAAMHSLLTGLLFYMLVENRTDVWIHLLHTLRWRSYEILKQESIFYPMAIKRWVQLTRAAPEGGREINCLHFKLYMKVGSGLWIRKWWVYLCGCGRAGMCAYVFLDACCCMCSQLRFWVPPSGAAGWVAWQHL